MKDNKPMEQEFKNKPPKDMFEQPLYDTIAVIPEGSQTFHFFAQVAGMREVLVDASGHLEQVVKTTPHTNMKCPHVLPTKIVWFKEIQIRFDSINMSDDVAKLFLANAAFHLRILDKDVCTLPLSSFKRIKDEDASWTYTYVRDTAIILFPYENFEAEILCTPHSGLKKPINVRLQFQSFIRTPDSLTLFTARKERMNRGEK